MKYRSLSVLLFYLTPCSALTVRIVIALRRKAQLSTANPPNPKQRYVPIYTLFAVLSLLATWSQMLRFFVFSYDAWRSDHPEIFTTGDDIKLLECWEMWLRQTQLFKEAWHIVVETPSRYWWSGQIFLWTTAWSVFLGLMGERCISTSCVPS